MTSIHLNIIFTTEIGQNNSNNFLEPTISRVNNFCIFRKYHTDTTIHKTSVNSVQLKIVTYKGKDHKLK